MSEQAQKASGVLYEDQTVRVNQTSVKVLKFYFPQDSKDQIFYKDINKLALKQMDEVHQTMGVDPEFFKDFNKRVDKNKNMYLEIAIQDQSIRLCFAPEQPLQVLKIIQKKWEEAKIEGQKQSHKAFQQNNFHTNVQVTAQKIQKPVGQHKKPEDDTNSQKQNQKFKRDPQSPSLKLAHQTQEDSTKKKIKQNQKQAENKELVQIKNV